MPARQPVIAGFQGITAAGEVTTFGRGGSDTTAVAVAAAICSGRVPDLHGRRRRVLGRPADRRQRPVARDGDLRGDAGTREPRLQGPALALGRTHGQVRRAPARSVEPHGSGRGERRHPNHHGGTSHGAAPRSRGRLCARRSQGHGTRRTGRAGCRLEDPRPHRGCWHRGRHDRPERRCRRFGGPDLHSPESGLRPAPWRFFASPSPRSVRTGCRRRPDREGLGGRHGHAPRTPASRPACSTRWPPRTSTSR